MGIRSVGPLAHTNSGDAWGIWMALGGIGLDGVFIWCVGNYVVCLQIPFQAATMASSSRQRILLREQHASRYISDMEIDRHVCLHMFRNCIYEQCESCGLLDLGANAVEVVRPLPFLKSGQHCHKF